LVGRSYSGFVITNAATGNSNVKALVYVDAFIPQEGDTLGGLANAQPGSCLGGNPANVFNVVPYSGPPADVHLYIKPNLVPGCFASGLPAPQAAVGTAERVIPPAQLTFMAKRAGAHITDVNAGHLSMISRANTVTKVIIDAANANG